MPLPPLPEKERSFAAVGDPAIDRATLIFDILGTAVAELSNVAILSVEGHRRIPNDARFYEILAKDSGQTVQAQELMPPERLAELKRFAAFAEEEERRGFPITWASVAIGLWGQLEAFAEDFAAMSLDLNPAALMSAVSFPSIKLSIGEYLTGGEDRHLAVVRLLQSQAKSAGVTQFEEVFQHVGLAKDPLHKTIRETLFELHHVRNVLVHRRGYADARFCEKVPHFGSALGERLKVDRPRCMRYMNAVLGYGAAILRRHLRQTKATPERLAFVDHLLTVFEHNIAATGDAEIRQPAMNFSET